MVKKPTEGFDSAIYVRTGRGENMEARRSQLTICRSVLADHGFTNPEVFEDLGQSGATTDRPAFQRLMDLIRSKEVRALAVSDMSRVTRAISDWAVFLKEIQVSGTVLYTKDGVSDAVKLN